MMKKRQLHEGLWDKPLKQKDDQGTSLKTGKSSMFEEWEERSWDTAKERESGTGWRWRALSPARPGKTRLT